MVSIKSWKKQISVDEEKSNQVWRKFLFKFNYIISLHFPNMIRFVIEIVLAIVLGLEIYRDNFFSPRAIMEDSRARNPHCSARDKRRTARIPIESSWIRSPVFRATKEAGPRLWMERKIRSPGNAYAKLCRRARKSMPPHRYEI